MWPGNSGCVWWEKHWPAQNCLEVALKWLGKNWVLLSLPYRCTGALTRLVKLMRTRAPVESSAVVRVFELSGFGSLSAGAATAVPTDSLRAVLLRASHHAVGRLLRASHHAVGHRDGGGVGEGRVFFCPGFLQAAGLKQESKKGCER